MMAEAFPAGRRGQTLAVAIVCLALTLVWFGVINPIWSWFDDRDMLLEQRQTLLQHMRDAAATLPALRAAAASNVNRGDTTGGTMLPGATDALAAAALQERVQKMSGIAGVSLSAVETLPAVQTGTWHKIPLRISLNAPWPVLINLLRAIEDSPVRILVDDVHFHAATLVARPTVLPIQASMVLYGFRPAEGNPGT